MMRPSYPEELEQWWLREAVRVLENPDPQACLDLLLPGVQQLSDLFTVARKPGFGGYSSQDLPQLAYGIFYFPQGFVRTLFALEEILRQGALRTGTASPLRVLDLGAGLGATTLAAAHRLAGNGDVHLTALDQSSSGLQRLERIFHDERPLWPHASLQTSTGDLTQLPGEKGWDLILSGFALNESVLSEDDNRLAAWARSALDLLAPEGVLLILEPATQESSRRIGALRDRLTAAGEATVIAPCLHQAPCPLLHHPVSWCHEVRTWNAPAAVVYLNRTLFHAIEVVKFCFLALRPGPPPPQEKRAEGAARLIAPTHAMKGKIVTSACAEDGQAHPYEILTRGMPSEEKERILALERGDRVLFENPVILGDGRTLRARSAASNSPEQENSGL